VVVVANDNAGEAGMNKSFHPSEQCSRISNVVKKECVGVVV
jgi:hypothetical protein